MPEYDYTDATISYILDLNSQRVEFYFPYEIQVFLEILKFNPLTVKNKKYWNSEDVMVEYVIKNIRQEELTYLMLLNLPLIQLNIEHDITETDQNGEYTFPLHITNVSQIKEYIKQICKRS